MSTKSLALAAGLGFVLLGVVSHLLRTTWLLPIYSHYELFWSLRAITPGQTWPLAVGQLLFIVVFIWMYVRGSDSTPWIGQGIRYGVLMTLLTVVPAACIQSVLYPVPYSLLARWIGAGGIELTLLALVVAWCCTPARRRA